MSAPVSEIFSSEPILRDPDSVLDGLLAEVTRLRAQLDAAERRADIAEANAATLVAAALELIQEARRVEPLPTVVVEPPVQEKAPAVREAVVRDDNDDYFRALKRSLEEDDVLGPREDDEPGQDPAAVQIDLTEAWFEPRRRARIRAPRATKILGSSLLLVAISLLPRSL